MRIRMLDAFRGTIIVVMALDHANSLIARGKLAPEMWASLFPNYGGDAIAFLTRFVTHLAAPGFFFLMGTGMALFTASRKAKGWDHKKISRFFALRGAILILFQFLLENPAWRLGSSGPPENLTYVGVLFALGSGMMIGSLFILIPQAYLIGLSGVLIVIIEFTLPAAGDAVSGLPFLQTLLMVPGYGPLSSGGLWVLYPILPWLGVIGFGIAFGRWLNRNKEQAIRQTGWIGVSLLAIFVVIRFIGGYGNIRPASGDSWIDFLNLVKYPPSMVFLTFTMGCNFLLIRLFAWLEKTYPIFLRPFAVFGRVPLFFYIAHLYFYAWLGQIIAPEGMPILQMYAFWMLGLAALLPLCWWYSRYKNSRPVDSIWRFL